MKKSISLVILSILVFSAITYAELAEVAEARGAVQSKSGDFSVEAIPIENSILPAGTARFNLRITNNENISVRYGISVENTGEWLRVDYIRSGVEIEKASSTETEISLRAREETDYGTYFAKVTVTNEEKKETTELLLPISIKTAEELSGMRTPDLRVSMDIPSKIDPREENYITVYLLNKNNRDLPKVTIELESSILGKKEIIESLSPNEEKEVKVKIEIDQLTKPQQDTLKGLVTAGGYRFTPTQKPFEVINYGAKLTVEPKTEKGFFKTTKTIMIENTGNEIISDTIKSERSIISSIFTKTDPEARIIETDNIKYYAWDVNVNPTVRSTITITTNYQPILWTIILIIIAVATRYMIKSKVRIYKKATSTEMSEGGLSNIKILLTIRNDTNKPIKEIEVKDIIPHIANIKNEFPMGTIKPDKILTHKSKGTIAKWKIDELDASEERIIKYEINTKLSILGTFTLPATKATYKTERGKTKTTVSDKLIVGKE